jgi:hypothetical protein
MRHNDFQPPGVAWFVVVKMVLGLPKWWLIKCLQDSLRLIDNVVAGLFNGESALKGSKKTYNSRSSSSISEKLWLIMPAAKLECFSQILTTTDQIKQKKHSIIGNVFSPVFGKNLIIILLKNVIILLLLGINLDTQIFLLNRHDLSVKIDP